MNTPAAPVNAYLKNRVMSASPEELRLMLLDGAIKFARQGLDALNGRNFAAMSTGITQCRNIIFELLTTIKDQHDPDLAAKVRGVYTFLYTQTVEASFEKDAVKLQKVIDLLEFERDTWVMLMQKLASEREPQGTTMPAGSIALEG